MSLKPALTDLPISTADSGFYRGFSQIVTITSKLLILGLVIWAIAFPEQSGAVLNSINKFILAFFGSWYIWTVTFFVIVCILLAIWPTAGRLKGCGRAYVPFPEQSGGYPGHHQWWHRG